MTNWGTRGRAAQAASGRLGGLAGKHKTDCGCGWCIGGNMRGKKHSTETRAKISAWHQARWANSLGALRRLAYEHFYISQEGVCAQCGKEQRRPGRRLALDHDHQHCPDTGGCALCWRGLLCDQCNWQTGDYERYGERIQTYLDSR